ncbi:MAG: helix-turn-helix domain-containing protein [Ruminococcaceae bacterium]|nr:helix-turn-helix domain-containing protein [Oscillospiraceae bacterium]
MAIPMTWQLQSGSCEAYHNKNQESSLLHGHYHFLINLITRGEGVQTINGCDVRFSPGQMFILSPADFHKITLSNGETHDYYSATFSYELIDKQISKFLSLDKLPMTLKLSNDGFALAKDIFGRLVEEYASEENPIARGAYMTTMVEQLVIIFLREYSNNGEPIHSAFLNRALEYLYLHFNESITVSDVAEHIGYTANYFNAVFKQSIGMPFRQYLREVRLNYASILLCSQDIPITEVAMESGFESSAHFSRSFHEKYGISPKEYRKDYGR